jgi:rhodanese-related sulfurtransferase
MKASAAGAQQAIATRKTSNDIPVKLLIHKPQQYDSTFAISATTVLYKLKQKQRITLVDIRSSREFERLNIPGSINIPLHAVKTKAFLKSSSIVLVNKGYGYARLEAECGRLKTHGFKVSILDGGIPAWHRKKAGLVGDLWALQEMKNISPQTFFKEKNFVNGLVIDISSNRSPGSKKLIPFAERMPLSSDPDGSVAELQTALKRFQNKAFFSVLVVDQNGDGYANVRRILEKIGTNDFYLNGGLSAYQRYLQHLVLSRQPRENRIKTVGKCADCGRADCIKPQLIGESKTAPPK